MYDDFSVRLLYSESIKQLHDVRFILKKSVSVNIEENAINRCLICSVKFNRFFKSYKVNFSISFSEITGIYEKKYQSNTFFGMVSLNFVFKELFAELLAIKLKQELSLIGFAK